jgi:TetR/AcrR family transcriptional regulator, transcriptional repressor for nem operon
VARPRRSADTRTKLLEEGVAQFLANGFHGTGIKAVLDSVGVPKGSFYNYFESKEDFGAATVRHYSEGLAAAFDRCLAAADDPVSGLDDFFEWEMRLHTDSGFGGGCLVGNLGAEVEHDGPCRNALVACHAAFRARIAGALGTGQERGLVRTDIPAVELADLLVDTWEGALLRMKMQRSVEPLRQCKDHLLRGYLQP